DFHVTGVQTCALPISVFAWLWPWLEKRGRNPSKPLKSAIGLLFAALSFLPLIAAAEIAATGAMASVWWLVLAYFTLELGEMCLRSEERRVGKGCRHLA